MIKLVLENFLRIRLKPEDFSEAMRLIEEFEDEIHSNYDMGSFG